jgi:plastocyanin
MKKAKLSIYCLFCFMLLFFLITSIGCSGTTATAGVTTTAMAGMTTSATSGTASTSATGTDVTIQSNSFNPDSLSIKVGDTVTWTNKDSYDHTVTSDTAAFDSGGIASGATFSFTFNAEGTYSYHCSIHTSMTAKIIVTK